MAKFTLHNKDGIFMHDTARNIESAKNKCDMMDYKSIVFETYYAKSPWSNKITEHGKEVYRNY